ncbi:MAG: hypothetical protein WCA34_18500, partial [Candidatus Acidiferrales bacterium]
MAQAAKLTGRCELPMLGLNCVTSNTADPASCRFPEPADGFNPHDSANGTGSFDNVQRCLW